MGLLQRMYGHFRDCLKDKYRYAATDVAKDNVPSCLAHKKRGFEVLRSVEEDGVLFDIVLWEWR